MWDWLQAYQKTFRDTDDGKKAITTVEYPKQSTPATFIDASFLVGDSPATLDLNTALGRNATEFMVINDGAGQFTVSISNDGISFGNEHTMNNGETYSLDAISVNSIRITHVADSSYRVIAI